MRNRLLIIVLVLSFMLSGCKFDAAMSDTTNNSFEHETYSPAQGMGPTNSPGSNATGLTALFTMQSSEEKQAKHGCMLSNQATQCYWDASGEIDSFTIDLSIAGDFVLATYMGQVYEGSFSWYAQNYGPSYFLENVSHIFDADDFTIVNLECVITDNPLKEVAKDHNPAYWFKGPSSNLEILTVGSVECVSLANNHAGDYGSQGRKDTIDAVTAAGLYYGNNDHTFYLEKNGFRIAVICHGLWGEWQADAIAKRIDEAELNSDYQIVFYHGGKEGIHSPEEWKIRASRKLVDAGADLVIGNHPHVLQPFEVYKGVKIVYSVGNFCYGGSRNPENRTIIYKQVLTIEGGELIAETSEIIPCYVYTGSTNNWQPAPIEDETQKYLVFEFMAGTRPLPY